MITISNLVKRFGTTTAVDGVSLRVEKGAVFGLLGPNGAGKSTTINMIVGLLTPDAGQVEFSGLGPPTSAKVRNRIGVATQELALYESLNAGENLRFFGRLYGLHGKQLRARVDAVLTLVGLLPRKNDAVKTFSGGMKRRLNLAIAMVHDPDVLLLDEPTAGVDPQSRAAILDVVRDLSVRGKTIVYTTHYMEEAQKVCARIAIMDHGKVLATGSVDELIQGHGGKSVVTLIKESGEEDVQRVQDPVPHVTRALATGTIRSVRIDQPDLETVFLAMTGRKLRD